jgi:hypothetical protein
MNPFSCVRGSVKILEKGEIILCCLFSHSFPGKFISFRVCVCGGGGVASLFLNQAIIRMLPSCYILFVSCHCTHLVRVFVFASMFLFNKV